jgi:hypothetical protein
VHGYPHDWIESSGLVALSISGLDSPEKAWMQTSLEKPGVSYFSMGFHGRKFSAADPNPPHFYETSLLFILLLLHLPLGVRPIRRAPSAVGS